jgi:hypothetical protein
MTLLFNTVKEIKDRSSNDAYSYSWTISPAHPGQWGLPAICKKPGRTRTKHREDWQLGIGIGIGTTQQCFGGLCA